jgi:hypothetical protein
METLLRQKVCKITNLNWKYKTILIENDGVFAFQFLMGNYSLSLGFDFGTQMIKIIEIFKIFTICVPEISITSTNNESPKR